MFTQAEIQELNDARSLLPSYKIDSSKTKKAQKALSDQKKLGSQISNNSGSNIADRISAGGESAGLRGSLE